MGRAGAGAGLAVAGGRCGILASGCRGGRCSQAAPCHPLLQSIRASQAPRWQRLACLSRQTGVHFVDATVLARNGRYRPCRALQGPLIPCVAVTGGWAGSSPGRRGVGGAQPAELALPKAVDGSCPEPVHRCRGAGGSVLAVVTRLARDKHKPDLRRERGGGEGCPLWSQDWTGRGRQTAVSDPGDAASQVPHRKPGWQREVQTRAGQGFAGWAIAPSEVLRGAQQSMKERTQLGAQHSTHALHSGCDAACVAAARVA